MCAGARSRLRLAPACVEEQRRARECCFPCAGALPSPRRGRIIVLLLSSLERTRRRPKTRQPLWTTSSRIDRCPARYPFLKVSATTEPVVLARFRLLATQRPSLGSGCSLDAALEDRSSRPSPAGPRPQRHGPSPYRTIGGESPRQGRASQTRAPAARGRRPERSDRALRGRRPGSRPARARDSSPDGGMTRAM